MRLLGLICVAVLALCVASPAMAQSPVSDQYQPATNDTSPSDTSAGNSTSPASANGDNAVAPVSVQKSASGKLPFTGGSVPLIALLGVGLLCVGLAGAALTRRRDASPT